MAVRNQTCSALQMSSLTLALINRYVLDVYNNIFYFTIKGKKIFEIVYELHYSFRVLSINLRNAKRFCTALAV